MAEIRIKINATEAKSGADQVNKAFDSMAASAVKTVKSVDAVQDTLRRQQEVLQANLKASETRFQAFAASVGLAVNKVQQSLAAIGVSSRGIGASIGAGLSAAGGQLRTFGTTVAGIASSVKNSFNVMGAAVNTVKVAFTGIVSALALRQLNSFAQEALDTASTLVDTADRIGITVEQLQELQFAASQSGVSTEQFAQSMQIFTRRLSEAAGGSGAARKAIQELGLDAKALAQDPAQALTVIADKIAGIGTQARRLEVANELFGRSGTAMVNLLQEGGPAIDALGQKLRDLGGVMGEETAREAERLGDEFEAVTQALGTQFKTALIELSPLLITVAKSFATAAKEAGSFFESLKGLNVGDLLKQAQLFQVTQQLKNLRQQVAEGRTGIAANDQSAILAEIDRLTEKQKQLSAELVNFRNVAAGSSTSIKKLGGDTEELTDAQIKAREEIDKLIERTKEHADTLNLEGAALADYMAKQALANGATKEQAALLREQVIRDEAAKKTKEDNTKAIQKQAEEQRKANALAKAIAEDEMKRAEFLADLQSKLAIKDQEAREASAKNLRQLQQELVTMQEEGRLIQASLAPKEDQRRIELEITQARIEREAANKLVEDSERKLTQAEKDTIEATKQQQIANAEAAASFAAYQQSIEDAALTTGDLEEIATGILQGTRGLGDAFEDLGKTAGLRMVKGILFGKGQQEGLILENFNQLLGVDAAGIFGQQGANLGSGLISSIRDTVVQGGQALGFDLGSIFGSSAGDAAGVAWEQTSDEIFAAGGAPMAAAESAGSAFGSIFGSAAAGAAGLALGKGLAGAFGLGGGKSGRLGGTIGGSIGAVGGGIVGSFFGMPQVGAALGGAVGGFFGTIIGGLFKSTPTKGTEIRKGVKEFLKDIEVSFADEIKSGHYFFEETKELAKEMFGGDGGEDFLKASKVILNDKIGPELSKQLQALGAFITADQAKKLGKNVEQTGTTFGNLLLDNLGLDPDTIDAAIQETIQKAGISFEGLTDKLTKLFKEGEIGTEFYKDAIMGAVDIFNTDMPEAINVSAIALKSFNEEGIFDTEKFKEKLEETTGIFEVIVNSFVDVVREAKPGEDVGEEIGKQIMKGIRDLAIAAYLNKYIKEELFEGIDLSDGLGADELALIQGRARDAASAVQVLRDSFGDVGDEVEDATEKVEDLFDKLREITQRRFELRLEVLGDLASIGAITGIEAAQGRRGAARGTLAGLAPTLRTNYSDAELEQGLEAVRNLRSATVELFQAQEKAANDALSKRIKEINTDYDARRKALQKEAQAAQAASEDRIQQLGEERDAVQRLYQERLDGLQEELQVAEDFRQVAQQLQQTINGLVQSASPFSQQEQFAVFSRQAAELRQRLAGASQEQRPELIQQLSDALSQQLQLGKGFLDPTAFSLLFRNIVGELETLRDQSAAEGNRVEIIQQQIADTTLQMEVQLRAIDARVEQARVDAQNAQLAFQEQAEALSQQEQAAVEAAQAETAAEIEKFRIEAATEIRNLALIEDAILVEQGNRIREQLDLTQEQVTLLGSINSGIFNLENTLITLFTGVISAQQGFEGVTTGNQLFLAHPNEHVKITPAGHQTGPITVSISVPLAVTGASNNPAATEEAIIQAVVTDLKKGGKIRTALKGKA